MMKCLTSRQRNLPGDLVKAYGAYGPMTGEAPAPGPQDDHLPSPPVAAPVPALAETASPLTTPIESPQLEGPTITVYLKIINSDGNDPKPFDILKKRIDGSPPIMAKTNEAFSYPPVDLSIDKYYFVEEVQGSAELTDALGLNVSLTDQNLVIRGVPRQGFDGRLNFVFTRRDMNGGGLIHHKPMYIAADPRTLWQNLEVEDYEGYPAPHEARLGLDLPALGKAAVAASCRGRSHAHAAKPRDDYFTVAVDQASGWHFAAVADGAGSARHSRRGAELAGETVVQELVKFLADPVRMEILSQAEDELAEWKALFEAGQPAALAEAEREFRARFGFDDIMHHAVYSAYQAIAKEAANKGAQLRDYHTTLMCAAFRKFSFGYFIMTYWVGDGGLCVYNWNRQGRVIVPGAPDGGEFAGQTRFLTLKEEIYGEIIHRRTRYTFADDFEALVLMTDGVSDPFFLSEKDVTDEEKWRAFWTGPLRDGFDDNPGCPELFEDGADPEAKSHALRRWLDFWSKGHHDDRTLLVIK